MRKNKTFSISFFIRKTRKSPDKALLYVRITVNGKSKEISLKRELVTDKWNQSQSKVQGASIEAQQINRKIECVRAKLYDCYEKLLNEENIITSETIKNRFLGSDKKHKTLLAILAYHSVNMQKVLKPGTLKNYSTTVLQNFI